MLEIARDLELEVDPEEVTDYLQSHDKTWTGEELFFMVEQREGFLEIKSTPGESKAQQKEVWLQRLWKWQQRI